MYQYDPFLYGTLDVLSHSVQVASEILRMDFLEDGVCIVHIPLPPPWPGVSNGQFFTYPSKYEEQCFNMGLMYF